MFLFGKLNRQCGLVKHVLEPAGVNQENDMLAFGFTTTDPDGTLVRIAGGRQYIELEIKDGLINLIVNLSGDNGNDNAGEERFIYSSQRLNDNTYHVVQMARMRNKINFRVDNFDQMKVTLRGAADVALFATQQHVYAGSSLDIRGAKKVWVCHIHISSFLLRFCLRYMHTLGWDRGIFRSSVSVLGQTFLVQRPGPRPKRSRKVGLKKCFDLGPGLFSRPSFFGPKTRTGTEKLEKKSVQRPRPKTEKFLGSNVWLYGTIS